MATAKLLKTALVAFSVATMTDPCTALKSRAAFVTSHSSHTKPLSHYQSLKFPVSRTGKHSTPTSPMSPTTPSILPTPPQTLSPTSLQMGYLPPSPKGPLDDIKSILPTIASITLLLLFFASPLGAIFFTIFNSLFLLAFLTPFVLYAGFQIWAALYTVEAPCPSCGVLPVRALKPGSGEVGEPSVCLNCGAYSRVNEAGDGLELCNSGIMEEDVGASLFDQLFGSMGGGGVNGMSGYDDLMSGAGAGAGKSESKDDSVKRAKRQNTIIDVDVERDD